MRSFAAGFAGAARGAAFAMPGGPSAAAFAVRRASARFYSLFTPSMRALARRDTCWAARTGRAAPAPLACTPRSAFARARRAAAFAKETRNAQECERRSV
ncbi:hypothetical protein GSH05_31745 [Burkholderia pseudomallei]|uniref:hypothetical protein n=1 Tax=Burkholderia pseudomallei TaxID=28450 RepID=UPI00057219C4|nr:hypothetical protein [Burkholderia pseudomallei]KAA8766996.1 hypothetical protein F5D26_17005 [Burkholderia pseudomallei]MBM5656028.1 hypothetical protein [Burkholderia pseudomallei]OMT59818.1 hypothetical protein AQ760_03230 [Burkholderia pseudomallei]OMZ23427.1 hypothetical protein AQ859_29480 [Burkholderia pseudomallei]OMZ31273.1 hypothetical protein AQ860_20995 [Burkholderia pseudomallei]